MEDKIKITDIYDKNINFLIGAGASYGLFPTLALKIKDKQDGDEQTIETLATYFDKNKKEDLKTLLFMHYYKKCIEPAMLFDSNSIDNEQQAIIDNYKYFLETILSILQRRNNIKKSCNIFTTNYDGCFAQTADQLLSQGNIDFIFNDGTSGFSKRYLQARNFNRTTSQTGVFERHSEEIPQINLIHLHGSVYWQKDDENIQVDYSNDKKDRLIKNLPEYVDSFSAILEDKNKTIKDIDDFKCNITEENREAFWKEYNKLPIVNPTKWKFHETVFEEHYYQMLRLLSYELEKPNSIFITFGFSFADEHIRNLIKRSLSNPKLQIFVCCYTEESKIGLEKYFKEYKNMIFITAGGNLNFDKFNKEVFTLTPSNEEKTNDLNENSETSE